VTAPARRRTGLRPIALALLLAVAAAPAVARKKNKREIAPALLPHWVDEAVARAPATSEHEVVWLLNEKTVSPFPNGGVNIRRRVVAKVYKQSGLDDVAGWAVYYVKGDRVDSPEAWTLRPDGTALRADPKNDVSDLPALEGVDAFNDTRVKVVETQGAGVGSVVAFESERWDMLDTGLTGFTFGSSSNPTLLARLDLQLPAGWSWESVVERGEHLEEAKAEAGVVYTGRDLQPLERERGRPAASKLLPAVWARWRSPDGTRGFESWDEVARFSRKMAEGVMEEPGEAAGLAERFKPREGEELTAALARAFEFAARQVRYVSIDLGLGMGNGFRPAPPATVCDKRYGDCKDKSYLMRALAEPWGVKTYAVLARTNDRTPVKEELPSPGQFNHCIAAVELPEGVGGKLWNVVEIEGIGRLLFLDATAREGSPWGLPWGVQGTTGLLVHPDGGRLLRLPMQPPEADATRREIEVEIDEQGTLVRATLVEAWIGNTAARIRSYYSGMSDEEHRDAVLEDLQDRFPGTKVADYRIEGLDEVVSPVVETTVMEGGRLGKRVGDLLILEPAQSGHGLLSDTLPKPPRQWPYVVGRPRQEHLSISLRLPDGWVPETIPEPLEIDSEYLEASAIWGSADGQFTYRRSISLPRDEIPAEDYAAFREEAMKLRKDDRQALVLVRE
jgi:hypothetical protein